MTKQLLAGYNIFLKEIKAEIQKRRHKALQTVNRELIGLYWEIGKRIAEKQEKRGWGAGIVENLAKDLALTFPDTSGFSKDNIWRMRKFFLTYRKQTKLAPLVQELSCQLNCATLSHELTNKQ